MIKTKLIALFAAILFLGGCAELQKNAEEALEYYPNQEEFLFFYGVSSGQLGDNAEAIYALEKLKKVGTSNLEMLGQAYHQLAYIYQEQE